MKKELSITLTHDEAVALCALIFYHAAGAPSGPRGAAASVGEKLFELGVGVRDSIVHQKPPYYFKDRWPGRKK